MFRLYFHQIKAQEYSCSYALLTALLQCFFVCFFHILLVSGNVVLLFFHFTRGWSIKFFYFFSPDGLKCGKVPSTSKNWSITFTLLCWRLNVVVFFRVFDRIKVVKSPSGNSSQEIRPLVTRRVGAAGCVIVQLSSRVDLCVCVCVWRCWQRACVSGWGEAGGRVIGWTAGLGQPGCSIYSASVTLHMASLPVYCTVCSALWHFVCTPPHHLTRTSPASFSAPWDTFPPPPAATCPRPKRCFFLIWNVPPHRQSPLPTPWAHAAGWFQDLQVRKWNEV